MKLITNLHDRVEKLEDFIPIFDNTVKDLSPNKKLYIGFIDGDGLKRINDTHGHVIGSEILSKSVDIIIDNIRSYDHLVRFGGDEFILLLNNNTNKSIKIVLDRIQSQLEQDEFLNSYGGFSYSMGIVEYTASTSIDELVDLADKAMYEAKQTKCHIVYKDAVWE